MRNSRLMIKQTACLPIRGTLSNYSALPSCSIPFRLIYILENRLSHKKQCTVSIMRHSGVALIERPTSCII